MKKAISLFTDECYVPALIPMINSILYNGVDAEIKVNEVKPLSHFLKSYLSKFVTVVELPDPSVIEQPKWLDYNYLFRPRLLPTLPLADLEICLDSDMVVLCDLSEAFNAISDGKLVCSSEFTYKNTEPPTKEVRRRWRRITKERLPSQFLIYNGGFLGFNLAKHRQLIDKWSELADDPIIMGQEPLFNDQMLLSALVNVRKTPLINLPPELWMTTWGIHKKPPKRLGFDKNGKIGLYEAKTGRKIRLYHFTGSIVEKQNDIEYIMRYHYARNDILHTGKPFKPKGLCYRYKLGDQGGSRIWYDMWEKRHNSPAAILADYMRDIGPLQVPKSYSVEFRCKVANLYNELYCESADCNHRAVRALCTAHDYLDLLNYRLDNRRSWMTAPLRALLGKKSGTGDGIVAWGKAPKTNSPSIAIRFQEVEKPSPLGAVDVVVS